MATPEAALIARIHRYLPLDIYREKMHNSYRRGTPDVWYSAKRDMWVEYKYGDNWLSALQHKWLLDRHKEGRLVAVIHGGHVDGAIRVAVGHAIFTESSRQLYTMYPSARQCAAWLTDLLRQ